MQMAVGFGMSALGGGGIGLPQIALFGASVVGSFLGPGADSKNSNRLNDLKVSSSTYGKGIAIVSGTMRCSGNMFWATDIIETKKYVNQKGKDVTGKKKDSKKGQPVYEYFCNFAMGLCEGPMEEVIRIWADSNLIYDKYNPDNQDLVNEGFSQEPEDDECRNDDKDKSKSSKKGAKGGDSGRFAFRYYTGSITQERDPYMVEIQGEDLVPAYRCLAYLMFEDFALGDFGNRIPTITAEVAEKKRSKPGATTFITLDTVGQPSPGWSANDPRAAVVDPVRLRLYTIHEGNDTIDYVRVYDLSTLTEINNKSFADIVTDSNFAIETRFHDDGLPTLKTIAGTFRHICGVDSQGKLLCHGQSQEVWLMDPNSLTITHSFGRQHSLQGHDDISVGYETINRYANIPYPTLSGLEYYSCVMGQRGDPYFFGTDLTPIGYVAAPGDMGSSGTYIRPGMPTGGVSGASYYLLNVGLVYRGDLSAFNIPSLIEETSGGSGDHNIVTNFVNVFDFFADHADAGDTDCGFNMANICIASESFNMICRIDGTNPVTRGTWAFKLDPDTGAVLWKSQVNTQPIDAPEQTIMFNTPIITGPKAIWRGAGTSRRVYEVNFQDESHTSYLVPPEVPDISAGQFFLAERSAILHVFSDTLAGGEAKWMMLKVDRNVQVPSTVAEIAKKIAERVGLDTTNFDFTLLQADEIVGHIIEQPTTGRAALEELFKVFPGDVFESDNTLKWVSRGQASAQTIVEGDMVPLDSDGNEYIQTIIEETELPEKVTVSFINPDDEYQTGTQYFKRPRSPTPVMSSRNQVEISVPLAMTKNVAKQMAQRLLYSMWTERVSYELSLSWEFMRYDPSDVLTFQMDDGYTFEARLTAFDMGADFTYQAKAVGQEQGTYTSTITSNEGDGGTQITQTGFPPLYSNALIHDIPTIVDADDVGPSQFIYYWGAAPFTPGFRYGSLRGLFGTNTPTLEGTTVFEGIWGTVQGQVPDPPFGFATDYLSEIILNPAYDYSALYTFASIPLANWISTDNAIVIGGELIYFRDAVINANGTITISHLIRMARGTDPFGYDHAWGESWHVVANGFEKSSSDLGRIGQEWNYRVSSPGIMSDASPTTKITHIAASLKPQALINLRRTENDPGAGDINIEWNRRSRIEGGGGLRDSVATVPLNEVSESYEIYILAAAYDPTTFDATDPTTYVRLYTSTSESVIYLAADQTTDTHTQADPVNVVGFQISDAVGRGFPGWDTLKVGDTNNG